MKKHMILWCASLILVLAACGGGGGSPGPAPSPPSSYTVGGTITLSSGIHDLTSATITLLQSGTGIATPDSLLGTGQYAINNVPPGVGYSIQVNFVGYATGYVPLFSANGLNEYITKNLKLDKVPEPDTTSSVGSTLSSTAFIHPYDIALSPDGNTLFVAATDAHQIWTIDLTTGAAALLAGSTQGYADLSGSSAQFYQPGGIGVRDEGGTVYVYVGDWGNNRIRKINASTSAVTTIAGDGTHAHLDGFGTAAQLKGPKGIDFDTQGNIYATEDHRICRIDKDTGYVSTVAGTGVTGLSGDGGPALEAQLYGPVDLVLDGAGNIYVPDYYNHRIRKITSAGIISTFAGSTTGRVGGDASEALFTTPRGITIDGEGNLYVGDTPGRGYHPARNRCCGACLGQPRTI
jgi:DNA-binding beta-propeller fold protein YncE